MPSAWEVGVEILMWQADHQQDALRSLRTRAGFLAGAAGVVFAQAMGLAAPVGAGAGWFRVALLALGALAAVLAALRAASLFLSVCFAENPHPGKLHKLLASQPDVQQIQRDVATSLVEAYQANEAVLASGNHRLARAFQMLACAFVLLFLALVVALLGGHTR